METNFHGRTAGENILCLAHTPAAGSKRIHKRQLVSRQTVPTGNGEAAACTSPARNGSEAAALLIIFRDERSQLLHFVVVEQHPAGLGCSYRLPPVVDGKAHGEIRRRCDVELVIDNANTDVPIVDV